MRDVVALEKGKPPAQQPYFGADAENYLTPDYLRGGASVALVKPGRNAVRVTDGDTIVLWDGSNAGEVMRGRAGVLASTMTRVVHGSEFNKEYFFYALKRWESFLKGHTSGSGIPHVDKEILGSLDIIRFEPSEQEAIADRLVTLDRAIEQTETLIAKQQRIKTGLMQDLLTRGIDEHGTVRSEQTHDFMDSPLGRIPVQWEVSQLGSVSEFVTSGARGWARYYREDGPVFLRIGNLTREHINLRLTDLVFVQPPATAEGRRTSVEAGDLLISVTADLGIVGVIPDRFGEAYVNQHIALVRLDRRHVRSRFVGWYFASREGQTQFDRLNEAGAKAGLNLPTVRSLVFARPDLDEQQRIAGTIDASVATLDLHSSHRQKLLALRTGFMQDLLTGKRRVTALLPRPEVPSA